MFSGYPDFPDFSKSYSDFSRNFPDFYHFGSMLTASKFASDENAYKHYANKKKACMGQKLAEIFKRKMHNAIDHVWFVI